MKIQKLIKCLISQTVGYSNTYKDLSFNVFLNDKWFNGLCGDITQFCVKFVNFSV